VNGPLPSALTSRRSAKTLLRPAHWYLVALGVAPQQQGCGLGSALLEPVLQRTTAGRTPCYLETFHARTVEFYHRFGFSVVHQDAIPNGGPSFWYDTSARA
jgi:GNAT superfamily N-acetyltransferase